MDSRIDLHLLRLFVAVAEELHFGRAARRLGTSQPPLSQQIRKLETLLGCALLERTSRRVALTDAGVAFLDTAYRVLGEMDRGIERARAVAAGGQGWLDVGYVVPAMLAFLPAVISRFRTAHPGVSLRLHEMSSAPQLKALAAGQIDVALVSDDCTGGDLRSWLGWSEPAVALLPALHPLAEREEIEVGELAGEGFVSFPRMQAPGLHERWAHACAAAGFTPHIVQEAQSWHMIAALVAAGLGVAAAPASVAVLKPPNVRSPRLRCDPRIFRTSLCTRADVPSPAVWAFIKAARLEAVHLEMELEPWPPPG